MAAIPFLPRSIVDPVPSPDVNIIGTFSVLRAAKAVRVRRVVYAASSLTYGDADVLPMDGIAIRDERFEPDDGG